MMQKQVCRGNQLMKKMMQAALKSLTRMRKGRRATAQPFHCKLDSQLSFEFFYAPVAPPGSVRLWRSLFEFHLDQVSVHTD